MATAREELEEIIARVLWSHDHDPDEWVTASPLEREDYFVCAMYCLIAIDTSTTHWIAPWRMTDQMHKSYNATYMSGAGAIWASLRDAYLAEQDAKRGDKG